MTEKIVSVNLNEQPAFKEIKVRPGVILRPLEANDLTEIAAIVKADPGIRNRVSWVARIFSSDSAEPTSDPFKADKNFIRFAINENGKCVGSVSLWRDTGYFGHDSNPNAYGFGYFLHPSARGKGLVTNSLEVLMKAVQKNLEVDSFMAFC